MFILALDHSSLFPVVMNLRVGISVLKNYLRPTVTFLQSGLTSGDTAILGSGQATFSGRDR